jgi:hypothetical protein
MESGLRLLGFAFANISKLRRANFMRNVAPNLSPLLKDPRVFSSRESDRLFGGKFIDAMVKEVDTDDKMAKIARGGGASSNQYRSGNSYRRSGDRNQGHNGGGGHISGFTNRNRRGSNNKAGHWHFITDDPWILSIVTSGYTLDFIEQPFQHAIPADCIMSEEMVMVCDQEVKALLAKGAVVEVPETEKDRKGFISNMFAIPKKLGGMRPILNLKCLNRFIVYQQFKMEGLDCVKYIIQPGDWMAKTDLQDAYFLVAVTLEHRKFLRFFWNDVLYDYSCLPFGLSSAPRVFTKLLKPVVAYLRELGIRLVIYLDDLLILNNSISGQLHDLRIVINLLESLGFIVNFSIFRSIMMLRWFLKSLTADQFFW